MPKAKSFLCLFILSLTVSAKASGLKETLTFCEDALRSYIGDDIGENKTIEISDGGFFSRDVKYQLPKGNPPPQGWPVVFIFQGSFWPVKFKRPPTDIDRIRYEAELIQRLLKEGFAVIAPRAIAGLGWVTNVAPYKYLYEKSHDFKLMQNALEAIDAGTFGPLDRESLFATGISSGGYNTSRMGLAFPNRFKALAIQSASYATCLGPLCSIPDQLPETHPATLLVSGEKDDLVPLDSVKKYYEVLKVNNIETQIHVDPNGVHGWFKESPELIVNWFKKFLD
jgi:poly(3-hydroxyoctanoate) depolymerase